MTTFLPAAHLALSLIIVIWDVVLAGRIAQLRLASRPFAALTGICGLMLLPALMLRMATSTFITGRAVVAVDWIWPVVLVLFAAQAIYAVSRRLVNYFWGVPIVVYNVLIAVTELVRFGVAHGWPWASAISGLLTAQSTTLAIVAGSPIAVTTPFFLLVPMISPAFPALRRTTAAFRAFVAAYAFLWIIFFGVWGLVGASAAGDALDNHREDRLRERPQGDFRVGLKIFPDIASEPSPAAVENDMELVNTLGVRAIALVVAPGTTRKVLDSLARVIDDLDDSVTVIVSVGYKGKLVPELGSVSLDEEGRLATVENIVSSLRPDILLPAEDPMAVGSRIVGSLPVERWQRYLTAASQRAKAIDPRVKIGYSVSSYGISDSLLYAWAASRGSPIDVVGFSFFPEKKGIDDIVNAFEPAADRWMKTTPPVKEHWVFAAGGYPLNSGERMQARIIWNALSWATDHPAIKGLVVYEASDYAQARGLRAPNGRVRAAEKAVRDAIRQLRESITG
ncbi:MAG TPA: hypothetical protein VFO55_01790 [Gemmatimonadaceae bacterium]|nr:hypothetical protein [Gemmatimonadaceae bacterium]